MDDDKTAMSLNAANMSSLAEIINLINPKTYVWESMMTPSDAEMCK